MEFEPVPEPTPEMIEHASLNQRDPWEIAISNFRAGRTHELVRKYTKAELLQIAFTGGLSHYNSPGSWTKQEIAGRIERQEWSRREAAGQAPTPGRVEEKPFTVTFDCGHHRHMDTEPARGTEAVLCTTCETPREVRSITDYSATIKRSPH